MPTHVVEVSALGERAAAWDALVEAMELPSPFLRTWWLESVADGSAVYVLVLAGDELRGGLALQQRRLPGLRAYRFLGSGTLCPDHLDVVCAPRDATAVQDELRGWANARGNRIFDLNGVAEHSRIASWLPHARSAPIEGAPVQPLPASAEEFLAERPRSFRKTVRRTRNRLEDAHARVQPAADVDAALDEFAALHRERGDRGELLAELPRLRRAVQAGAAVGEAWVETLTADHKTLAVSIAYATGGRVSLYQTARSVDADNASTILNLASIERAIDAGCSEVDLLRGHEPYKRHYAEGLRAMSRVGGAHGPLGVALLRALGLLRAAKARVSRVLPASAAESGS